MLQQSIRECPWIKPGTFVLQLLLLSQYDKALLAMNPFYFLLILTGTANEHCRSTDLCLWQAGERIAKARVVTVASLEKLSCCVSVGNQEVQMYSIDHYNLSDVSLIKIDVEGYEQQVLEGAIETIVRCKPALYVENDREDRSDALCSFIESIGYSMEKHNVPLVSGNNYRDKEYNIFPGIYSLNMLCLSKDGKG
jgi:Methyltransferase FkbM domain